MKTCIGLGPVRPPTAVAAAATWHPGRAADMTRPTGPDPAPAPRVAAVAAHPPSRLLSLFAGALSLALGLWVWRRNQASPAAGSYLLLALTIAAWTIPEGAMRLSPYAAARSG